VLIQVVLGYSTDPASLSEEDVAKIDEEATEAVERWEEDADLDNVLPRTPLQHLLAQYHDLGQEILDIQDDALMRRGDIPSEES